MEKNAFKKYRKQNQIVQENIREYDKKMTAGAMLPIYRFGDGVVDGKDLKITNELISIPSIKSGVSLRNSKSIPRHDGLTLIIIVFPAYHEIRCVASAPQ